MKFRRPRTTNERRAAGFASDEEAVLWNIKVRRRGNRTGLVDAWDLDEYHEVQRSWKWQRKGRKSWDRR